MENCLGYGGFLEICAEITRIEVLECLDNLCQIDIPGFPCKVGCGINADKELNNCLRNGGLWEDCAIAAAETTLLCRTQDCSQSPTCDDGDCVLAVYTDRHGDAMFRPTDAGRTAPFDPESRGPIDLLSINIGGWVPFARPLGGLANAFAGEFALNADLVRIDLVLRGLVNPPGPIGPSLNNPYRYGTNPVYGFVEIDMDGDLDTGGELNTPEFRYLSNVARFGGRTGMPELFYRELSQGSDLDGNFETAPFVERSGEEFHIALLGNDTSQITVIDGDTDRQFEPGESWLILGRHFHRAHGFEPFSFIAGGDIAGEYAPIHPMVFAHDPAQDVTRVTIVFPITQFGAAILHGEPEAPVNSDPTDQTSVFEALVDLRDSADFIVKVAPTGLPEEQLIVGWSGKNPSDYLDPRTWSPTAILGTAYAPPGPPNTFFVWTDVFPNPELGDVDSSGYRGLHDALLMADGINANDFQDGVDDESAPVPLFAQHFSVFDVNYDGVVDRQDVVLSTGDTDRDGDADLRDFARLQLCFGQESAGPPCLGQDFDRNLSINNDDMARFRWSMGGPDSQ